MKITNTVYQVDDVTGTPSLIIGDQYLTLIDAGVPGCEVKIFAAIESLGPEIAEFLRGKFGF